MYIDNNGRLRSDCGQFVTHDALNEFKQWHDIFSYHYAYIASMDGFDEHNHDRVVENVTNLRLTREKLLFNPAFSGGHADPAEYEVTDIIFDDDD